MTALELTTAFVKSLDTQLTKTCSSQLKPSVLRPDHNRMATTLLKPQKSKQRTNKYQIGIKYHKWPKKFSSVWRFWFPTGRNVPVPSQGRYLNHHSAPTEPNVQLRMACENLSPHTIVISKLWKNLPKSEPARLTRTKAHWFQEPVGTVDNTDTRLRETLTAFRPLRPALEENCHRNHFWNRAAVTACCRVSLFMVLYHHPSPLTTYLHWGGQRGHPQAACSPWRAEDS